MSWIPARGRFTGTFIAEKKLNSFCKSPLPHKSVSLFLMLGIVKDKLTWELTFAKRLQKYLSDIILQHTRHASFNKAASNERVHWAY